MKLGSAAARQVHADVYRLHHIPLKPITLQALLQRGPTPPSTQVVQQLQQDPVALQKWRETNASKIVSSAQLLHREVPIRLARRIVDLENLPQGLAETPSIVNLRERLLHSFDEMFNFPKPHDLKSEEEFTRMQVRIRSEHFDMHRSLIEGLQSLDKEPPKLTQLLDSFYTSRISIRMIVDQHIASQKPTPGFSGIIEDECCPWQIAKDLVDTVTPLWKSKQPNGKLPEFVVEGDDAAAKYRYIPQHIEIILLEVIKNAVINSLRVNTPTPPPVRILVAGGAQGVCIKVSDLGGGMTREQANALFAYHHQAKTTRLPPQDQQRYDPISAGLETRAHDVESLDSFGLRIAALYAQYFGGQLSLMPMERYGTDAYIYMNCLKEDSELKGTASS